MADKKKFDNEEFLNYIISSVFYPRSMGDKGTSARDYAEIANARDKHEARNILLSNLEKNPEYFKSALDDYSHDNPDMDVTEFSFDREKSKKRPINIDAMDIEDVNYMVDALAGTFGMDRKQLFEKLYNDPEKKEKAYDDRLAMGSETLKDMFKTFSNLERNELIEKLGLNPDIYHENDKDIDRKIRDMYRPYIERSYKSTDYGLGMSILGSLFAPNIIEAQRQGKGATAKDAVADIALGAVLGKIKAGAGALQALGAGAKATGATSAIDLLHDMADESGKRYVYSEGDERTGSAADLFTGEELEKRGKDALISLLSGAGIGYGLGKGAGAGKRIAGKISGKSGKSGGASAKLGEEAQKKVDDLEYALQLEKENEADILQEMSQIKKSGAVNGKAGEELSDAEALSGLDILSGQRKQSYDKQRALEREIAKITENPPEAPKTKSEALKEKAANALSALSPYFVNRLKYHDENTRRHAQNAWDMLRN